MSHSYFIKQTQLTKQILTIYLAIPQADSARYLGMYLDSEMTWKANIEHKTINALANRISICILDFFLQTLTLQTDN